VKQCIPFTCTAIALIASSQNLFGFWAVLPSVIQNKGLHTPHWALLAPKPFAPTCHGPLPAFLACHPCALSPPLKMAGRSTAGRSSACQWRNLHSCCPAFGPLHQSLHTKRGMFSGDHADPRGSAPGDAETLLLPELG